MRRMTLVNLVFTLLLIPLMGINCDSNSNVNNNVDLKPPIISVVSVSDITETTAIISWTTDEPATSSIEYGQTDAYGSIAPNPSDDNADKTTHSVNLSALTSNTTYHFCVISNDSNNNKVVSEDKTFTTLASIDAIAPVISEIITSGITESGVTITWVTDEPATSTIFYGESP